MGDRRDQLGRGGVAAGHLPEHLRLHLRIDLVIRSGYFPKPLGVLLIVGCFGYLAALFTQFLAPDARAAADLLTAVGGLPEFVLIVWLLVKGVRVPAAAAPVATAPQP